MNLQWFIYLKTRPILRSLDNYNYKAYIRQKSNIKPRTVKERNNVGY